MEDKLIKKFLDDVFADKFQLKKLKQLALDTHNLELVAEIRGIEREKFPDSDEEKKAKEEAIHLTTLFRMVELNIPQEVCYIINETIKKYRQRRGNFDLHDAARILANKHKIFG